LLAVVDQDIITVVEVVLVVIENLQVHAQVLMQ
jgi:hypothetical protein